LQLFETGFDESMASNGDAGAVGHISNRVQPRTVSQLQVKGRGSAVETAFGIADTRTGSQCLHGGDQLRVGVRDRADLFSGAVIARDPDVVAAVAVDVLDRLVSQQQRKAAKSREAGGYPLPELLAFAGRYRRCATGEQTSVDIPERLLDGLLERGGPVGGVRCGASLKHLAGEFEYVRVPRITHFGR
jgi:hypothetical protein